ncbi:amino acid ABC transporter substrate-binding protein [Nonomuraea sp. K274]|uniref:Amino acid ABC transporter substrate-binding protein n=1 Tax=Nonomuraea cypriaca TaxID=1187855 RepID=A0A931AMD3_9ACTN|nr:ABC transporter substrate-binding protein [Nonomuraea cypriaca]MBF8191582.1 amino acid ABC transporter substrate-binding protein [Nonomuraea cypriaca]
MKMARRPAVWRKSTFVPAVVFTGRDRAAQVRIFAGAIATEVPYADVSADHEGQAATFRELIDRAAGEKGDLGAKVPGSLLPAPRFPLTQIILRTLRIHDEHAQGRTTNDRGNGSQRALDSVYEDGLREWRRRRAPLRSLSGRLEFFVRFLGGSSIAAALVTVLLTAWLDTAGAINAVILVGSILLALLAAELMARFWSSGTYRHGWFYDQPYVKRNDRESLVSYLRRVAELPDSQTVDRLLMFAFIEDLRLAYSRRRPWPGWGRGGYAVLRLGEVDGDKERTRFLRVMHKILTDTGLRVPLLVIVEADTLPPDLCAEDHPAAARVDPARTDLLQAYDEWAAAAVRVAPCPYLVVDTDVVHENPADLQPLQRRAIRRLRPLGYWLVVAATILAPLGVGGWVVLRPCEAGLSALNGECVGLSTATENFDPALAPILNLIVAENNAIAADAKVFRLIYFGQLTRRPAVADPGNTLVGTAAELTGVYARQRDYNRQKSDWRMYVEFANPGQDYERAEVAARAIVERAAWDRSIAAVLGLGWSRTEVREALGILRGVQLPALATTATADRLPEVDGEASPYFYRLAPANSMQALAAAHWLAEGLPVTTGEPRKNPRVGILWQDDPQEIYSVDLADEFAKRYPVRSSERYGFSNGMELKKAAQTACGEGVEVLFYTGRGDLYPALKEAWGSYCADKGVIVLSGDDVTSTVATEVTRDQDGHNVDLRFISLSDPRTGASAQAGTSYGRVVQRTMKEVETERGKSVGEGDPAPVPLPPDHAMLAHDGALAVTSAFDGIQSQGDGMDVRAGVQDYLRGLNVTGATGAITFLPAREPHNAQDRTLWLMSVAPGEELKLERVCRPKGSDARCGR